MNIHHIVFPTEISEGNYTAVIVRKGKLFTCTAKHKRTGKPLATVSRRHLPDIIKAVKAAMKEAQQ